MSYLTALVGMWCPSAMSEEALAQYYGGTYVSEAARQEEEERKKYWIVDKDHFAAFARPEPEGGASGVKILRDKNGVLHVVNTKSYPFHYQYCVAFLNENRKLEVFNEQAYTGKDRSMMFATIVSYPQDRYGRAIYCLELNPADPMVPDLDKLDEFFAQVKAAFMVDTKNAPELYFHPTSTLQAEATKNKKLSVPVIQASEIFGDIAYKVVVPGRVNNKLVSVFSKEKYTEEELVNWLNSCTTEEIVVIPSVPNDIPAVGGVICNEIIPPLCHVALLCQNRKSPCCYYKDATKQFHQVQDSVVSGVIAASGFYLDGRYRRATKAEVEPVPPVWIEAADTSTSELIELDSLTASNPRVVGAKAAQLAQIEAIYKQPIFKGTFIVPFHHYNRHLSRNHSLPKDHLHPLLNELDKHTRERIPFNYNKFSMFTDKLVKAPIDAKLVQQVIDKIAENKWTSVILRSSTNAEDLVGFNGAGLYESIPLFGDDVTSHEKIGIALKTIWASLWSPKAVKERHHYRIDQRKVMMAVLVQPFISGKMPDVNVVMNGVCITHDASRHRVKNGFVVHTFPGSEHRVTNHYKDAVPESVTLLLGRQNNSVDMLLNTLSNISTGPLLAQSDAVTMTEVFGKLHNTMLGSPHSMNSTTALDIEFLIIDDKATNLTRELVVLQARPYQVIQDRTELETELQYTCTTHFSLQPNVSDAYTQELSVKKSRA